jgi:hypothetical protein
MNKTLGDEYTCSGWACTDCLMLLANGEGPSDRTDEELAAWQAGIDEHTAGYRITLGLRREEHACATNYTVTARDGTEFDFRAESKSDAHNAFYLAHGSGHGGARFATAHELQTEADRGGECECETDSFSWSACDVCGSNLGGERHAVSFWKITEGPGPASGR